MPIYEYKCSHCLKRFEVIKPLKNRNKPERCKCGARAYRRQSVNAKHSSWSDW